MDFEQYYSLFDEIQSNKKSPYDNPYFLELVKLNLARTKRWLKWGEINKELKDLITTISEKQNWLVISEHWCGDSANILPFIYKLSQLNPLINLTIQLRDSDSEIDSYLTNGKKSIPVFVVRDEFNNDILLGSSRPIKCQSYFENLKLEIEDADERKRMVQVWYNEDKGKSFQEDLLTLFKSDLNHIIIH